MECLVKISKVNGRMIFASNTYFSSSSFLRSVCICILDKPLFVHTYISLVHNTHTCSVVYKLSYYFFFFLNLLKFLSYYESCVFFLLCTGYTLIYCLSAVYWRSFVLSKELVSEFCLFYSAIFCSKFFWILHLLLIVGVISIRENFHLTLLLFPIFLRIFSALLTHFHIYSTIYS